MNYWQPKHQQLIEKYYWCYTASTSASTRNLIVTKLYTALQQLSKQCLYSCGAPTDDENIQICMIFITTKLLPKIKPPFIQGSLQYIWISTKRYIIDYYFRKKKTYMEDINSVDVEDDIATDSEMMKLSIRQDIFKELDRLMSGNKVLNCNTTLMILLMKDYLLENEFDPAGFSDYAKNILNINNNTYLQIMNRLGIKTNIFNKKIIKN